MWLLTGQTPFTFFFWFLPVKVFASCKRLTKYWSSAKRKSDLKRIFITFPSRRTSYFCCIIYNLHLCFHFCSPGKQHDTGMPVSALPPHGCWGLGAAVKYKQEKFPAFRCRLVKCSCCWGETVRWWGLCLRFMSYVVKKLKIPQHVSPVWLKVLDKLSNCATDQPRWQPLLAYRHSPRIMYIFYFM